MIEQLLDRLDRIDASIKELRDEINELNINLEM